jgi:hypothetical protein
MVRKEKIQKIIIKVVSERELLSHKGLKKPITANPKSNGDTLMIGINRILNCWIILSIEIWGVISDGMIKVQKNI